MDYAAASRWLSAWPGEVAFALIIGRHSGVYPRRFRSLKNIPLVIDDARDPSDLRPYLRKYLPEGVYYDRNAYTSLREARKRRIDYTRASRSNLVVGQELAFDIDPENLDCPEHGSVEDKMRRHEGLSFCDWEFQEARRQAGELHDRLQRKWHDVAIVYSGRGFHVHVRDPKAFRMSRRERSRIARALADRYAADEWVTTGEMRLIRLPHSLNGLVSRICIPVARAELDSFAYDDPRAVPPFARP